MSKINKVIVLAVVTASFFCTPVLNAQEPSPINRSSNAPASTQITADRSFNMKALTQLTTKLAEAEGRDAADINANVKAEQDAEAALKEATNALAKAQLEVFIKSREAEKAEGRFNQIQLYGDSGQIEKARSSFEKAVTEREKVERTIELLREAKTSAEARLNQAKLAEQAIKTRAARRAQQKTNLIRLNDQWENNPIEENLIALTDEIIAIACEQDVFATPLWKTTPTPGATLYYQSIGERRRKEAAHPINNPTETQQPICLGRYYIWSERFDEGTQQNKVTSDKNKRFDVYLGIPEIIVLEHQ
jgi:hypothetical protein